MGCGVRKIRDGAGLNQFELSENPKNTFQLETTSEQR